MAKAKESTTAEVERVISVTVTAEHNKTTKNMYRYQTLEGENVQGSFYVPRSDMGATPAPTISATVEFTIPEPSIFEENEQDGF